MSSTFGSGLDGFGFSTRSTVRTSSLAVPGSIVIWSPTSKAFRLAALIASAPARDATDIDVPSKRSAPVSKLYAIVSRLYQCSSALFPPAE